MATSAAALSGIFSGIDTEPFITRLLALNSSTLTSLQIRQSTELSRKMAFNDINSLLGQFSTAAAKLRGVNNLRLVSTSTGDNKVATSVSSAGALEGIHSIEVNRLATAHREVHAGVASLTSTVGSTKSSGQLTAVADPQATLFTAGAAGATYDITFDSQEITGVTFAANTAYTLEGVRDAINAQSQAQFGYDAASIELDGGVYSLKVVSRDYGSAGEMSIALTAGDEVAELASDQWTATNGTGGVFSYTYNGVTRTINLGDGATLSSLQDMINNDSSNPGIRASIIEHEATPGQRFHLVLAGAATGAQNSITINETTTLGTFSAGAGNWVTTQAQDSQFRIDGYPSGEWMTRSSNTVSDVISGMTLTLTGAGSTTITATRQTQTLANDLGNLVAIYNSIQQKVAQYTGYSEESGSGILQGENAITNMLKSLRNSIMAVPAGFVDGSATFIRASQIGIDTDKDGAMTFDSSAFSEAVAQDYDAVLKLIGASGAGAVDSDYFTFTSATSDTATGQHEVEVTFDEAGRIATARIRRNAADHWRNLQINGNTLMGQEGQPEEGLVLAVTWDGASTTQTTNVTVSSGLASSLEEMIGDFTEGLLGKRIEYVDQAIETLDANIETQQNRLDQIETRLRAQFARMETQLAELDAQSGAYSALFASLKTNQSNS